MWQRCNSCNKVTQFHAVAGKLRCDECGAEAAPSATEVVEVAVRTGNEFFKFCVALDDCAEQVRRYGDVLKEGQQ